MLGGQPRARGVTMLELVIVVALTAVTAAVAVPPLLDAWDAVRLRAYAHTFLSHLLFARNEAIKRRARVVLCPSEDGVTCADAGAWSRGWLVFVDGDNSGQRDSQEPILVRHDELGRGFRLTGNQNVAKYLSYDAHGQTRMTSGAFQAGTYTLCRAGKGYRTANLLVLSSTGRPRLTQTQLPTCA